MTTTKKSVCIVGTGVAGLVTTKIFLDDSDNYEVTVFEKHNNIGGLWHPSRILSDMRTNSMKKAYGFSELPLPDHFDEYPTAAQMFQYLDEYAVKFKLRQCIQFGVDVIKTHLLQEGVEEQWEVTVMRQGEAYPEVISFDILIVATGLFTKPLIPKFKNQETYTGTILHSSKVLDTNMLKNKHVLVIGSGKSGTDMALLSSKFGVSTTMAFRKAHWVLPGASFGRKALVRSLFMSKLASRLFPYYYKTNWFDWFYSFVKPLIRAFEYFVLYNPKRDTGLSRSHNLFPNNLRLWADPSSSIAQNEFYNAVKTGAIKTVLGSVEFLGEGKGVLFSDGTTGEYDLVILSTGYSCDFTLLDEHVKQQIQLENNDPEFPVLALYRLLIPLGSRSIGFVGFLNCTRNPLVYELSAHWLSEYFLGRIKPSETEMKKDLQKRIDFAKKMFNKDVRGGYSLLGLDMYYINQLLEDIKLPQIRTSNFFKEYFAPVFPVWYESITQQKMAARKQIKVPTKRYFGFCHFLAFFFGLGLVIVLAILIRPYVE